MITWFRALRSKLAKSTLSLRTNQRVNRKTFSIPSKLCDKVFSYEKLHKNINTPKKKKQHFPQQAWLRENGAQWKPIQQYRVAVRVIIILDCCFGSRSHAMLSAKPMIHFFCCRVCRSFHSWNHQFFNVAIGGMKTTMMLCKFQKFIFIGACRMPNEGKQYFYFVINFVCCWVHEKVFDSFSLFLCFSVC